MVPVEFSELSSSEVRCGGVEVRGEEGEGVAVVLRFFFLVSVLSAFSSVVVSPYCQSSPFFSSSTSSSLFSL